MRLSSSAFADGTSGGARCGDAAKRIGACSTAKSSISGSAKVVREDLVRAHRARALNPETPFIRGTAHNPDTYFQAREAVNPYYAAVPGIVEETTEMANATTPSCLPSPKTLRRR